MDKRIRVKVGKKERYLLYIPKHLNKLTLNGDKSFQTTISIIFSINKFVD